MYAQATPFAPFFDALLSSKEAHFMEPFTVLNRKAASLATVRLNGDNLLSMPKACERLSLLAQLELPCTILITNPPQHLRHTVIKQVNWGGESMAIEGDGFNLLLRGSNFHAIRLVNPSDADGLGASLDICHADGLLYASIQPAQGEKVAAIWLDVMENPTLCLV